VPAPAGAPSSAAKRVLFALAALLCALLFLELGAAVGERACYGTSWRDGQPTGLYANAAGEDPRLRAGARLEGRCHVISVNADGFRGAELRPVKPADGLRIWFLGGSTTFDIYASDDAHAWPALAAEHVARAFPARAVEAINAGVPGEVLEGNRARLLADGRRLRPDVVAVYAGPNDLRAATFRPGAPLLAPPATMDISALARLLYRWGAPIAARRAVLPSATLTPDQRMQLRNAVEGVVTAARAIGARPVLVTHALRVRPDAGPAEAQASLAEATVLLGRDGVSTRAAFDDLERLVRDVGTARAVPVIDLRAAVPADEMYWGDATHFADPGSARAGSVVGEALVELLRGG
jgi:lysophospholipase L1-like esterase